MKIVMHVDMNSYFASVEQQANPFLRGKPVAVCSRLSPKACVIACSIEAKALGIKTGFNLAQARELAPNLVVREVDPPKIRTTTKRIFKILADYTPTIEAYSIDEAFLDLTGYCQNFVDAEALARMIKIRIKNEVGEWLRCSIGISHTRWLAKFAGEFKKPDGLTVLHHQNLPKVYENMPTDEAWGIAAGWRLRLASLGIRTLKQLLDYNPNELMRVFGKPGYILWSNIAGLDVGEVTPADETLPKSIGHSYVLPMRTNDEKYIGAVLMKLCERVGRRLRRRKLEARKISVGWGYEQGGDSSSVRTCGPIFESFEIFSAAWRVFYDAWNQSKISFLAITATNLSATLGQLSIFNDRRKHMNLSTALDKVNDRYGEFTIIRGRMFSTKQYAPDRIGFRQSTEVEWRGEPLTQEKEME